MLETVMLRGKVKSWYDNRGFGFILGPNDIEHFVHYTEINVPGFKSLRTDELVSFVPYTLNGRHRGKDVVPFGRTNLPPIRKNPFNPHSPVHAPHLFCGRARHIHAALGHLANKGNILILGERGIGKSSVLAQLENICEGDTALLQTLGFKSSVAFNRLVAHYVCRPGQTLYHVLMGIAEELGTLVPMSGASKTTTSWGFEYILNFKRTVEMAQGPAQDVMLSFNAFLDNALRASGRDGICIAIDEIDVLDAASNLTAFVRATREARPQTNVVFMVSGVTEGAQRVAHEHCSHRRVFEQLEVDAMSPDELEDILHSHLADTGVAIETAIAKRIVKLSSAFPYCVHYLGHHCFNLDTDGVIKDDDLNRALNLIVNDLRHKDFASLHAHANSDVYSQVIGLLARIDVEAMTPGEIAATVGKTSQEIGPVLKKLTDARLIRKTAKDRYAIIEPLFKIYCRWYGANVGA